MIDLAILDNNSTNGQKEITMETESTPSVENYNVKMFLKNGTNFTTTFQGKEPVNHLAQVLRGKTKWHFLSHLFQKNRFLTLENPVIGELAFVRISEITSIDVTLEKGVHAA